MINNHEKQQILFLSEKLGVNVLLDNNQQVILLIDGAHPISIRLLDGEWHFYAMICYASDVADSNKNYKKMLSVNMNEQKLERGGLCIDESENAILYGVKYNWNNHEEDLYEKLNIFVIRADAIREILVP